jgi:flavin reductase (DIM6/NTAB) family NADH-FMN oxidoreductase RutF
MEKIQVQNQVPTAPLPVVVAGTMVNGKANYITIGAYGVMSIQPPVVYISSMKSHFTNAGIKKSGYFSINVPSADLVTKTDYCGLVSGRDADKSDVFTTFFDRDHRVPMAAECPVNAVCKVVQTVDLTRNEVFIGEVVECHIDKDCLVKNVPDIKKIGPLLLGGRYYWKLGAKNGTAFQEGKSLMKHP